MFCSFWACLSFLAAWYLCCNHDADKIVSMATISNPEGTQLYVHLSRRFFLLFFSHSFIFGWWFGTCFISPYIGNFIMPTDFHSIIFQRGRSTTNQPYIGYTYIYILLLYINIVNGFMMLYDSHITTLANTTLANTTLPNTTLPNTTLPNTHYPHIYICHLHSCEERPQKVGWPRDHGTRVPCRVGRRWGKVNVSGKAEAKAKEKWFFDVLGVTLVVFFLDGKIMISTAI